MLCISVQCCIIEKNTHNVSSNTNTMYNTFCYVQCLLVFTGQDVPETCVQTETFLTTFSLRTL